ncbi:MAG: GGDEF domain-containing protein [candidate division Zixibacteria bacterium]|nr:GGDEF domain-containing protein [candidate division Zixibacteria bacterium]
MPNTKNTILENWANITRNEIAVKPVYHFALKQTGVNLDFHLKRFYYGQEVSFHYFDNFDSLVTICQRFPVNAILIGSKSELYKEIEMLQAIKSNVFLSIIPVILYHPEPSNNIVVAAFENGAEDFIYGEWLDKLVEVRIHKVIDRNRRDLSINPSTHLPGPAMIEQEIDRQIKMGSEFAVCYADLDNFKAYNDYYGYASGDRVIRLTAKIIRDVVFDVCREGFVGHIAGDDFICVLPQNIVNDVCTWIIKSFDAIIPYRYEVVDRERGYITTVSRRGEIENYPILTSSIAVLINDNGKFTHVGELSKMLADLKKATKQKPGSNFMVERRKKY